MSDDLVKRLRQWAKIGYGSGAVQAMLDAADHIEKMQAITKDDAQWLAAYHQWCKINGCAPSSSDLINVRKAQEGKDD